MADEEKTGAQEQPEKVVPSGEEQSGDAASKLREAQRRLIDHLNDGSKAEEYAVALADAARRAHDQELAALANLTLIRSGMTARDQIRVEPGKNSPPSRKELDERLRNILNDLESS